MNVAILCAYLNSPYARELLRALNARGLSRIDVVAADGGSTPRTTSALWGRYGWRLPWAAARWTANRLMQWLKRSCTRGSSPADTLAGAVQAQGGQFICVRKINGEECRRTLQALRVDLLLLAGTPIIRQRILEVADMGTLNAHQGALPRFRGMNAIEWAVLEGSPPTVSVHFVDTGVDTGDIVATEPVPIAPGDTFDSLRIRASAQQIDLLARTARAALAGPLPRRSQRRAEGRQYFPMHPTLRAVAKQRLREHALKSSCR